MLFHEVRDDFRDDNQAAATKRALELLSAGDPYVAVVRRDQLGIIVDWIPNAVDLSPGAILQLFGRRMWAGTCFARYLKPTHQTRCSF